MTHEFKAGFCTDQYLPWELLRGRWELAEEAGFDSIWLADHLLPWWVDPDSRAGNPPPWDHPDSDDTDPYLEAWSLLGAMAALTSRVEMGVLVSDNLLRHPVIVAKMAVTLDHVSNGRVLLGLGAGWMEQEHRAYGFPFGTPGERVERFRESVEIIVSLMKGGRTTYNGRYVQLDDAPFSPLPVYGRMPLVLAGSGPRMLKIIARHADVWNVLGTPEFIAERGRLLNHECETIGRDPAEIRWSYYDFPPILGMDPFASADNYRQIAERYREVGVSELIFEIPHPDSDQDGVIREIGAVVLPEMRGN